MNTYFSVCEIQIFPDKNWEWIFLRASLSKLWMEDLSRPNAGSAASNGKLRPKSLRLKGEAAEGESGSLACRTLSMFLPPHLLALPQHQYQGECRIRLPGQALA
ncbi:hypothetical protein TNCT_216231 [Trichonephila clavata]|uniref:Uncharacterized protein n=1 Tax=Trichonephila clavata TaxID=2740835 RepID=A0A8X6IF11_TRICU|nr:hypothetical protein TNCT_216231 [Trichonephila clavata]